MAKLRSDEWYAGVGPQRVPAPGVDATGRAVERLQGPSTDRHRQHRLRPDPLQLPPRRGGRRGEAGRVRRGRGAVEPAGRLARGNPRPAYRHALAEHGGDGDGGDVPGQPHRRSRPARRLRQDDPGAVDGGGQRRPPGRGDLRRTDAERDLPGAGARLRHRRLAAERGGPGGHSVLGAVPQVRVVDDPEPGPLQHHGHCLEHEHHGRGARHDDPGAGRNAGPGQPAAGGGACVRSTRGGSRARGQNDLSR